MNKYLEREFRMCVAELIYRGKSKEQIYGDVTYLLWEFFGMNNVDYIEELGYTVDEVVYHAEDFIKEGKKSYEWKQKNYKGSNNSRT